MATTAATSAVYSQMFKKRFVDALRVGTGRGLCFCGINVYLKNEKCYDGWAMPLFGRLEPETAYAVAQKAAKYNLVSKEKLHQSKLLVSTQPRATDALDQEGTPLKKEEEGSVSFECVEFTSSEEDLMDARVEKMRLRGGATCEASPSKAYDSEFEVDESCLEICIEDESVSLQREVAPCDECYGDLQGSGEHCCSGHGGALVPSRRFLSEAGYPSSELSCCGSPRAERNCVTPDSPSLSMRVNIASPLRSSKMSLATMIDGTNPNYDRHHLDEEDEDMALRDDQDQQGKCGDSEDDDDDDDDEDDTELRTHEALLPQEADEPCGLRGMAITHAELTVMTSS